MVSLAWSMVRVKGLWPTVTLAGARWQPRPVRALHAAPLITDTVSPGAVMPLLATYTVSVAVSTSTQDGPALSVTVRLPGRRQPRVTLALQVPALITETVRPVKLAT